MKTTKLAGIFVIFFLSSIVINAQGFRAGAILGLNASQIDGDDLAGYDKLGLTAGLKIQYRSFAKFQAHLELLYSQRGSQSELRFGSPVESVGITLNYIEIPIVLTLNDWYQTEGDFYKVRLEGGFSYGYLFDVQSNNTFYDDQEDRFTTNDFSYLIGAFYYFNRKWAAGIRYTRSFNKLYNPEDSNAVGLLSYFITLRSEYHF